MENLNKIVSKNLIKYRTLAGLTQLALAEKINYSDKAVSKWERGDCFPDLSVLVKLSEIYHITINDFLDEKTEENKIIMPKKIKNKKHRFITLMATGLTLFIATILFSILYCIPQTTSIAWYSFIYCIPVCGIVLTVFSCLWGNQYTTALCTSIILWGVILCLYLSINYSKMWIWFVAGAPFQILILCWFFIRGSFKKLKNILKKNYENEKK